MAYYKFYLNASTIADQIRSGEYKQNQQARQADTEAQTALIRRPQKQDTQEAYKPSSPEELAAHYMNLVSYDDIGADFGEGTGGLGGDYLQEDTSGVWNAPPGRYEAIDPATTGNRLIRDLTADLKLTKEQAAGIVGNLAVESNNFQTMQEVNPLVKGSRGGYGFAQWTGPRRVDFENWANENGLSVDSYEANYGFLKHELLNTPEGNVLSDLRQTGDAASAARIFSDQFLRPKKETANLPRREGYANKYAKEFKVASSSGGK